MNMNNCLPWGCYKLKFRYIMTDRVLYSFKMTETWMDSTYEKLFCSAEHFTGMRGELISLSALNIFLSLTAIIGNVLIQVALFKVTSLHSPMKLLLRSLSVSDLLVGLISVPLAVTYWMSVVFEHWRICPFSLGSTFIASYTLGPVSLLTLTAISVDRLLALNLGLGYRQVVTLKRIWAIVISFWVVSFISATIYLWDFHITLLCGNAITVLCLLTSVYSYTRIYLDLRQHRIQVRGRVPHEQASQECPLNVARYRKAVSSALWLQWTLILCYLPIAIVGSMWIQNYSEFSSSLYLARQCAASLVFLNSSLNPILYFWKIRQVRQAVKDTIKQLCDPRR